MAAATEIATSQGPPASRPPAGIMNAVGWGGALGPVFVGLISKFGRAPTEVQNRSNAIAFGALFCLVSAALLLTAAMWFSKHTPSAAGAAVRPTI